MPSFEPVRFGIIGSGWITETHLDALAMVPEVRVVALADYPRDWGGRPGRGRALSEKRGIDTYYDDYRRILEDPQVEVVTVSLPNALHGEVAIAALEAGKHIIVEKPLCLCMDDARRIVALAKDKGLVAGYAEELCYCPKLVEAKALVDAGAIGDLFWLKQTEVHEGPYSDWFFDPLLAGGGALMDMGCHAIEYARWMFAKAPVRRVTAHMATHVHGDRKTPHGTVEDQCLVHLELAGGQAALLEAGWTLKGGMDSLAHLQGTEGVLKVDLLKGNGLELFSSKGLSDRDVAPGWSRPGFEWLHLNGYPQEMLDFARAIRTGARPVETAEDGLAVLEIMWAAYASAREGRAIELPYAPPADVASPVSLWIQREADRP